jgi:hypothetical protein
MMMTLLYSCDYYIWCFGYALFNSTKLNHGGITIISGVEELPLHNLGRPSHGGITLVFSVGNASTYNSRTPVQEGITITPGMEKIPNPSRQNRGSISPLFARRKWHYYIFVWCVCSATT